MKKQKKRTKKIMKRTKKIMKKQKNKKKIMKRTNKIMKGGSRFRFDDEYDDLETFSAMLGDDFDDICTWEGQLPLILSTEVSRFQEFRGPATGWIFDSLKFHNKYMDALKHVIDIWEEDADEHKLTCAIEHLRKYQMLLYNPNLSEWFELSVALNPGVSIEMMKNLLLTVIYQYKIKWTNPYSGNSHFLDLIPINWPQHERDRRKTILQMMDLYDRYSGHII
jgi:hypothetical protein